MPTELTQRAVVKLVFWRCATVL